jgi:hypothetical protein
MRLPYGKKIDVARTLQPFDSLVDEDLMHEEIGDPIDQDPETDPQPRRVKTFYASDDEQSDGRDREDQEEGIVPFQEAVVVLLVMVGMQVPKESVHHVLMRGPCHEFHEQESAQHDTDDDPRTHPVCNTDG